MKRFIMVMDIDWPQDIQDPWWSLSQVQPIPGLTVTRASLEDLETGKMVNLLKETEHET